MLKITVAVLAVVLAGTASAAGWRSLRLDGSSEAGFEKSLAEIREKLPPVRQYAFLRALHDIWDRGTKNAEADEREYTDTDYLRQLDGLGYDQVVTFTDPTGETARRNRAAARQDLVAARQDLAAARARLYSHRARVPGRAAIQNSVAYGSLSPQRNYPPAEPIQ